MAGTLDLCLRYRRAKAQSRCSHGKDGGPRAGSPYLIEISLEWVRERGGNLTQRTPRMRVLF